MVAKVVGGLLVEEDEVVTVAEPRISVVGTVVLGGDWDVTTVVSVAGLVQFPAHAVVASRRTVWVALG